MLLKFTKIDKSVVFTIVPNTSSFDKSVYLFQAKFTSGRGRCCLFTCFQMNTCTVSLLSVMMNRCFLVFL